MKTRFVETIFVIQCETRFVCWNKVYGLLKEGVIRWNKVCNLLKKGLGTLYLFLINSVFTRIKSALWYIKFTFNQHLAPLRLKFDQVQNRSDQTKQKHFQSCIIIKRIKKHKKANKIACVFWWTFLNWFHLSFLGVFLLA